MPGREVPAAHLFVDETELFQRRDLAVAVVIFQAAAIPQLVAVPNRPIVKIAEIGGMAENRGAAGRLRLLGSVRRFSAAHPHPAPIASPEVGICEVRVPGVGIAGDLLAFGVEILVDLQVLRKHRVLHTAGRGTVQEHGHGRVHGLADGDVGMFEQEEHHRPGLGFGEGILSRAALGEAAPGEIEAGHGPPILDVVAVEVQPSDAVLVETAVAVVVDPFGVHDIIALTRRGPFHQPPGFVVRIDDHRALARLDLFAHLQDEAVAVQVLGRVLVQQPVAVVVIRTDGAAVGLGGEEIKVGAVGVVFGLDVKRRRIDHPGDFGVLAVIGQDVPGKPQGGLGRRHLARMAVALDKHGRLVRVLAQGLVRDRHLHDVAAFE